MPYEIQGRYVRETLTMGLWFWFCFWVFPFSDYYYYTIIPALVQHFLTMYNTYICILWLNDNKFECKMFVVVFAFVWSNIIMVILISPSIIINYYWWMILHNIVTDAYWKCFTKPTCFSCHPLLSLSPTSFLTKFVSYKAVYDLLLFSV